MPHVKRRAMLAAGVAVFATRAFAQTTGHEGHTGLYEGLREPGRTGLPPVTAQQWVYDSPAPKAPEQGRWTPRAPLPLPRSEMAWATEHAGRMHLVGGYGEQRVDRTYHHVYDQASDKWLSAAALPRGANHVGVAVLNGKVYAIGGFTGQNHTPHDECFVFDPAADSWRKIASLPRPCGAIALVAVAGRVHAIGGAIGEGFANRVSVNWHIAYDPAADKWEQRAPFYTPRDHTGVVAIGNRVHLIGGRVDTFFTNSNFHHVYDATEDKWQLRAPLPTARSGHGSVLYRGKIFCMGGEGSNRVFAQNEAYDPQSDSWMQYAPMLTPRHGLGAVTIGDFIHVAGGGPIMGGGVQSAVHEAFTLA
jgi:N-acetylneuraminic acid mutarotase